MSDTDIDFDEGAADGAPKKKLSGKVIVLYIALPVLLLIGAVVGAMTFLGSDGEEADVAVAVKDGKPPVFYDMPEFLVNISTNSGPTRYLKMRVAIEVPNEEALSNIEVLMPRIVDGFQVYLRELRPEDLDGSAAIVRMKEELLRRLNLAVEPYKINDVLFKEVVVQ
ncbi:MAG: flagellar basal body-associated FliL family protein [Parvibaculaceae bacterium]